jgi:hypothetical protein
VGTCDFHREDSLLTGPGNKPENSVPGVVPGLPPCPGRCPASRGSKIAFPAQGTSPGTLSGNQPGTREQCSKSNKSRFQHENVSSRLFADFWFISEARRSKRNQKFADFDTFDIR